VQTTHWLVQELGIPNATLQIDMNRLRLSAQGADRIDILLAPTRVWPRARWPQVASGGEFSATHVQHQISMAEKTAMPTLISTRSTTGISGEVAMKLGTLMKTMANTPPVDCHQSLAADRGQRRCALLCL